MFVPGKIPAGLDNEKDKVFPAKAGFWIVYVVPFKENVIPAYTCPSLVPVKEVEPAPALNCREDRYTGVLLVNVTFVGAFWAMFVLVIV